MKTTYDRTMVEFLSVERPLLSPKRRTTPWSLLTLILSITATPAAALGLNCQASTAGVAFGNYNPINTLPATAVGNVGVFCTVALVSVAAQINISLSPGLSGSFSPRNMLSGTNQLHYNLYTNLLNTTIWGDGTSGTGTVSHNLLIAVLGTAVNSPVYGSIPAGQYVPAGSYTDTITVTVEYHEGL